MSTVSLVIRLFIILLSFVLPLAFIVHDARHGNYEDWLFGSFIGFEIAFCVFIIVLVI